MPNSSSLPYPLGVSSLTESGANVAVYSETADSVSVVTLDENSAERSATTLPHRTGHVFHGLVPDLTPGTRYGLRVDGPWNPEEGLRHNSAKLLLDPYATAITGQVDWDEAVFRDRKSTRLNSSHPV